MMLMGFTLRSTHSKFAKILTLSVCILFLSSLAITPLHAQLSPARDLSGTWKSSISGTYYEMDPSDPNTRMDIISGATFTMTITQQGSQITIVLESSGGSWTTDNAYLNEYGMNGVPPAGGMSIRFVGTVSSASFSADDQDSQLVQEHIAGTFTTDIITATLTGTSETTDQNGIIVTRISSPSTSPIQGSTASLFNQPVLLATIIFVVALAIAISATAISKNGKKTRIKLLKHQETSRAKSTVPPAMPPQVNAGRGQKMSVDKTHRDSEPKKIRFCGNCGRELPIAKKFCPFCGNELSPNTQNQADHR